MYTPICNHLCATIVTSVSARLNHSWSVYRTSSALWRAGVSAMGRVNLQRSNNAALWDLSFQTLECDPLCA
jgi:hypothetical protein